MAKNRGFGMNMKMREGGATLRNGPSRSILSWFVGNFQTAPAVGVVGRPVEGKIPAAAGLPAAANRTYPVPLTLVSGYAGAGQWTCGKTDDSYTGIIRIRHRLPGPVSQTAGRCDGGIRIGG